MSYKKVLVNNPENLNVSRLDGVFIDKMEPKYIDVKMGEWEVASSPHILKTIALGPCIGIAIYDPKTKKGALMHNVEPLMSSELANMVKEFDRSNRDSIEVTVSGGSIDSDTAEIAGDYSVTVKGDTENYLNQVFSRRKINYQWGKVNHTTDMELDTRTGEVKIESEDCSYLDDY